MSAENRRTIPRRQMLIAAGGLALVACTRPKDLAKAIITPTPLPQPTKEPDLQIQEKIIPLDTVVIIKDVKNKFTGRTGIEEIRIVHDSQSNEVVVFTKPDPNSFILTPEVRSMLGLKEPLEGFISYDPSLNLTAAMSDLEQLNESDKGIQAPGRYIASKEIQTLIEVAWRQPSLGIGVTLFAQPPNPNADIMYATDANQTRPRNSINPADFSTAGILQVKFRFTKNAPVTPSPQRQPQST